MGTATHDVAIVGGGFAGLTLARQLRQRLPALDVAVIEHRRFPVREGLHKVGESTVEIASHYLAHDLGLGEHLRTEQLPKFGLRIFCRGDSPIRDDMARYDEIGASSALPIPTYQLDRGRLENHLAASWRECGKLLDGTTVRAIESERTGYRIVVRDAQAGIERSMRCRYLVDASGRRAWLRHAQRLSRSVRHGHHAVWFRVAGAIDVDAWSTDSAWLKRCHGTPRRLSTNHFTGPGYWLWLIPLASGMTSVGLVFDPRRVRATDVRTYRALIGWLAQAHPLVAAQIAGRDVLDRHAIANYAVGSKQVFGEDWATVGDAGVFTDPFYSPGGDFIALANGYVTALIGAGRQANALAGEFNRFYQSFFANTLAMYRGQYAGFGNSDLMVAKTLWDYTYYWSVLSKLFFAGVFADISFMQASEPLLHRASVLHARMQRLFRELAKDGARVGGQSRFYDHGAVPLFRRLQEDLLHGNPSGSGEQLQLNVDHLESVVAGLQRLLGKAVAGGRLPPLDQLSAFE